MLVGTRGAFQPFVGQFGSSVSRARQFMEVWDRYIADYKFGATPWRAPKDCFMAFYEARTILNSPI